MDTPYRVLAEWYRDHLGAGRLAAVAPLDPRLPRRLLTESLERCRRGDVHELDALVAESVREFACGACLEGRDDGLDHFCAAVLLTHLLCFDGAGFGHTEAPLIIAISAIRGLPSLAGPSSEFLRAMLDRHAAGVMGPRAAYLAAALCVVECAGGAAPTPDLIARASDPGAREGNEDRFADALVRLLMAETRRRGVALAPDISKALERLGSG